jgi:hypothetical protein
LDREKEIDGQEAVIGHAYFDFQVRVSEARNADAAHASGDISQKIPTAPVRNDMAIDFTDDRNHGSYEGLPGIRVANLTLHPPGGECLQRRNSDARQNRNQARHHPLI